MELADHVLKTIIFQYFKLKEQADRAISQISDDEFFTLISDEDNSIAILVKHITGNMRSRWTDFLNSDGEKQFRNRPDEFELTAGAKKDEYLANWEKSWEILKHTLDELTSDHLLATVTIRQEPHTVVEALNRQLTHYAAHIGQIVMLAKYIRGSEWKTLSIPKNTKQFEGGTYKK